MAPIQNLNDLISDFFSYSYTLQIQHTEDGNLVLRLFGRPNTYMLGQIQISRESADALLRFLKEHSNQ